MSSRINDNFQLKSLFCRDSNYLLWEKAQSFLSNQLAGGVSYGPSWARENKTRKSIVTGTWTKNPVDRQRLEPLSLPDTQTIAHSRKAHKWGTGKPWDGGAMGWGRRGTGALWRGPGILCFPSAHSQSWIITFLINFSETILKSHNWSKFRKQLILGYPAPADTSMQ